jgi:hypothetical protein
MTNMGIDQGANPRASFGAGAQSKRGRRQPACQRTMTTRVNKWPQCRLLRAYASMIQHKKLGGEEYIPNKRSIF